MSTRPSHHPFILLLNRHVIGHSTSGHHTCGLCPLLSILELGESSTESLNLLAEFIGVLLMLTGKLCVLLVSLGRLVARLGLDLLERVDSVSCFLDLVVDFHNFVLDGHALSLVCLVGQSSLIDLIVVLDDLYRNSMVVKQGKGNHSAFEETIKSYHLPMS